MNLEQRFRAAGRDLRLADFDPADDAGLDRADAEQQRAADLERLRGLQERLYAEGRQALLVVVQALDAAGKDGTISHVMSGVNPQGVQVTSFKQPSAEELAHDWLWRCSQALPPHGSIGIFNRSHYEEVLVLRVHPEYLAGQGLDPKAGADAAFWAARLKTIAAWERHLGTCGTQIVKFFLHVSRCSSRAPPSRTSTGSSARATSPSARAGTPTGTPTRRRCARRAPTRRRGTSSPPTTSG